MSLVKYIKRVQYIDFMIRKKATGDLESFAKKNRLSKSTLSEIINQLKEMGFPIKYDRSRRTYYYEEEGEMIRCLFLKYGEVVTRGESVQIGEADKLCFSPSAIFELCTDK